MSRQRSRCASPGHVGLGALACLPLLLASPLAHSDPTATTSGSLPTVSVKAPRSVPARTDKSVTVITRDAIERSPATTLTDLLATEANLAVQSFYGSDAKAGIDMRGMGDTATSNVLIVVDGERLNEYDLSGADLSSLALTQIERIEVVRGGGAVRHGPGAVAGVIEITTRRPEPGPAQGRIGASIGSFNGRAAHAAVEGGSGALAARVQASHQHTDGHRDNSAYWSNKASGEVRLNPTLDDGLTLDAFARMSTSRDRHGLPGPLSIDVLRGSRHDRQQTNAPFDRGETRDDRLGIGLAIDGQTGRLGLQWLRRDRHNPYLLGFTPIEGFDLDQQIDWSISEVRSRREEWQLTQVWNTQWAGLPQSVELGAVWSDGRYRRSEGGVAPPDKLMTGEARSASHYADLNLTPWAHWRLHAGARQDRMDVDQVFYSFGSLDSAQVQRWRVSSTELGLSWRARADMEPYASLSRHTRLPNLDELALATPDLRPQSGRTREVGLRYTPSAAWKLSLSTFRMVIDDEIYFGPTEPQGLSLNRNFPWRTVRRGAEADAQWQVIPDRWQVRAQAAYVKPTFAGLGTDIPLVARRTYSLSSTVALPHRLEWTLTVRASSRRHDGNDWLNELPTLRAYQVADTLLSWDRPAGVAGLRVQLGIQNLLNEVYTTKAYSQTVYPMPGRSFRLSLQWAL